MREREKEREIEYFLVLTIELIKLENGNNNF